jgi:hypothetical protein
MQSLTFNYSVGRVAHPDMPEQKASGNPVYGPSAIAAKGGKFRQLPGVPGYVTVRLFPLPLSFVNLCLSSLAYRS